MRKIAQREYRKCHEDEDAGRLGASIKQHDNSLLLSKNTKSSGKITVRSMTVAPGEIKVQNKHHVIQHTAQENVATSTHSMNDVMAFYVFNTRFESSASIAPKDNIFCTQ